MNFQAWYVPHFIFWSDKTHSPLQWPFLHLWMPGSPQFTSGKQFEMKFILMAFQMLLCLIMIMMVYESWHNRYAWATGKRGPKFHKKMLIIFHQQEIKFEFISPGGFQPKTLYHFQGTQNTVLWKSPNMEGQRNVFVFWLERQSSLSASGFTVIASSLGSTVVSEGSMSKRQGKLNGSYRGESDGDGRSGHQLWICSL